jgi:uncharacterized membrane protein
VRVQADGDRGSVLVLTIGFVVVLMLLLAVVVDSSKLFLSRRALASVADGAATAAAQQVDTVAVYLGGAGATLPLSPTGALAAATASVQQGASAAGLTDVTLASVTVTATQVDVTVTCRVQLPLAGLVTGSSAGVVITVTARAESAVAR